MWLVLEKEVSAGSSAFMSEALPVMASTTFFTWAKAFMFSLICSSSTVRSVTTTTVSNSGCVSVLSWSPVS